MAPEDVISSYLTMSEVDWYLGTRIELAKFCTREAVDLEAIKLQAEIFLHQAKEWTLLIAQQCLLLMKYRKNPTGEITDEGISLIFRNNHLVKYGLHRDSPYLWSFFLRLTLIGAKKPDSVISLRPFAGFETMGDNRKALFDAIQNRYGSLPNKPLSTEVELKKRQFHLMKASLNSLAHLLGSKRFLITNLKGEDEEIAALLKHGVTYKYGTERIRMTSARIRAHLKSATKGLKESESFKVVREALMKCPELFPRGFARNFGKDAERRAARHMERMILGPDLNVHYPVRKPGFKGDNPSSPRKPFYPFDHTPTRS